MSGNYGWGGRDRSNDYDTYSGGGGGGFSQARSPYNQGPQPSYTPTPTGTRSNQSMHMTAVPGRNVDLSPRKHIKTTKDNVLIVSMDRTGSMGTWRAEIFQRLPLLYKEAQKYLGESLEIIFMGFGDVQLCGDKFDVAPSGCGPELDGYITALDGQADGGGNAKESAELPAYYVSKQIDTSDAKAVFFFTITDEGFYDDVSEADVEALLGLRADAETVDSCHLFQSLKTRMNAFVIRAETDSYSGYAQTKINDQWKRALGEDCYVPLDDARRVVDVMLGVIAKVRGQFNQFSQDLSKRQGGTPFGGVNIKTVTKSISMVRGAPSAPPVTAGTKSLLSIQPPDLNVPAVAKPGTKSLLKDDESREDPYPQ